MLVVISIQIPVRVFIGGSVSLYSYVQVFKTVILHLAIEGRNIGDVTTARFLSSIV